MCALVCYKYADSIITYCTSVHSGKATTVEEVKLRLPSPASEAGSHRKALVAAL